MGRSAQLNENFLSISAKKASQSRTKSPPVSLTSSPTLILSTGSALCRIAGE